MNEKKIHIGDTVSVIDENLSGKVTWVTKFVISMEDEHGFIHHYQPNELVILKHQKTLLYLDFENFIPKEIVFSNKKEQKSEIKNKMMVVDLHIHQLTDSNKNLSNFEMLSIQLKTATQELEKAIKTKQKKIVFIHGVGAGVLKQRLLHLFTNYPVKINDGNYKKYGKGAMELTLFTGKLIPN